MNTDTSYISISKQRTANSRRREDCIRGASTPPTKRAAHRPSGTQKKCIRGRRGQPRVKDLHRPAASRSARRGLDPGIIEPSALLLGPELGPGIALCIAFAAYARRVFFFFFFFSSSLLHDGRTDGPGLKMYVTRIRAPRGYLPPLPMKNLQISTLGDGSYAPDPRHAETRGREGKRKKKKTHTHTQRPDNERLQLGRCRAAEQRKQGAGPRCELDPQASSRLAEDLH